MSVRDKSIPRLSPHGGRPPKKRTKEIATKLLEAVAAGAPYTIAAASVGICFDTFIDWRRKDRAFAAKVEEVAAQGALKRLKRIEQHGEENFAALSWMLERRFPQEFSRPEVQLNLAVQNNVGVNARTINASDFQTVVVSDLEYLQLREQGNYEHHRETPIREVESVSEELSGHLTRKGANGLVISQSQADVREQRLSGIRSKFAQLLEQTPGEH
jgi:hypothetical protein